MDLVPVEVVATIFSFSSKLDVRSLRLVCRSFGALGEEYLFTDWIFHLQPREKSLQTLEAIANHPRIPRYLDTLVCETEVLSDIDEFRVWKAAIVQEQWNGYTREHATPYGGHDPDDAVTFHNQLDASFLPGMEKSFEEYRHYLDLEAIHLATVLQQQRLFEAMRFVIPKRQYKVSMSEAKITLDELCYFHNHKNFYDFTIHSRSGHNKRARMNFRRSACQIHFLQYLSGIANTCLHAHFMHEKELVLDGLPIELLEECYARDGQVRIALPPDFLWDRSLLRTAWSLPWSHAALVHVGFRMLPYSDRLQPEPGLQERHYFQIGSQWVPRHHVNFLNLARRLEQMYGDDSSRPRRLSLSFGPEINEYLTYAGLGNILATNTSAICKDMGLLSWTRLQELRIDHFTATVTDVEQILQCQPSVVHLTLRNGRLVEQASLVGLIHALRRKGDLRSICIEGSWISERDYGQWKIFNQSNFCEGNLFDGPFPERGLRWRVEDFILHGGVCPLKTLEEDHCAKQTWDLLSDESWQYKPF